MLNEALIIRTRLRRHHPITFIAPRTITYSPTAATTAAKISDSARFRFASRAASRLPARPPARLPPTNSSASRQSISPDSA